MAKLIRLRSVRVLFALCAVIALFAIAGWKLFQPGVRLASEAEIRAVMPKELLVETPADPQARERYTKLSALAKSVNQNEVARLLNPQPPQEMARDLKTPFPKAKISTGAFLAMQYVEVKKFWAKYPHLLDDLSALVESGPFQVPPPKSVGATFPELTYIKALFKATSTSARVYADFGENEQSVKLILLSLKLNDRLFADGGTEIDYLVAIACDSMLMRAVDLVGSKSSFPVEDCRLILAHLAPAAKSDDNAANALRTDFQQYAMKFLAEDPRRKESQINGILSFDEDSSSDNKSEPFAGNYDALDTAKGWAKGVLVAMSNARKPLSEYDASFDTMIDRDSKTLPKEPNQENADDLAKWWSAMRFRFEMNFTHNSIGRRLLDQGMVGQQLGAASCKYRAMRDAARVLLASRIYRSSQNGMLPPSPTKLVPLLGDWPQDPFNGRLMIYLPKKEVVYTVGSNLIDDGGDLGKTPSQGTDTGISLKLDQPDIVTVPLPPAAPSGLPHGAGD